MHEVKDFLEKNKLAVIISIAVSVILYISFGWYSTWNPDSLCRIMYTGDKAWVAQARWMAQLWEQIFRSQYTIPVLTLIYAIIFLSIIPLVIIYLFNIRNIWMQVLIILSIMASLHQGSTMSYAYCRDEFTFAYLLSVLCASFLLRVSGESKPKAIADIRYDVCAIVSLVLFLAIYQSYLSCTMGLLCVGFFFVIISEKKNISCILALCRIGIDMVVGLVLYLSTVKLSLILWDTEMSSYRNMDKAWFNIGEFPSMIKEAYESCFKYYFTNYMFYNDFRGKKYIHAVLIVLIVIISISYIYKNIKNMTILKFVLLCIELLLMPVLLNIVFLMTTTGVSFMMIPGVQYLYVICAIMIAIKQKDLKGVSGGITVEHILNIVTVFFLIFVLYTNIIQIFMLVDAVKIETGKAQNIASNLDYSIRKNQNYASGTKILISGDYKKGNYPDAWGWEETYSKVLKGTILDFGQFWYSSPSGTMNCWQHIFMYFCGTRYSVCDNDTALDIISTKEYISMPVYPAEGSMKVINDVFVVKMSE